jgi:hypothetical protein
MEEEESRAGLDFAAHQREWGQPGRLAAALCGERKEAMGRWAGKRVKRVGSWAGGK